MTPPRLIFFRPGSVETSSKPHCYYHVALRLLKRRSTAGNGGPSEQLSSQRSSDSTWRRRMRRRCRRGRRGSAPRAGPRAARGPCREPRLRPRDQPPREAPPRPRCHHGCRPPPHGGYWELLLRQLRQRRRQRGRGGCAEEGHTTRCGPATQMPKRPPGRCLEKWVNRHSTTDTEGNISMCVCVCGGGGGGTGWKPLQKTVAAPHRQNEP